MPAPRPARRLAATGLAALLGALSLVSLSPPAGATVTHQHGFRATVDGFTSWYGSYGMAAVGTAWCIDHGIAAPDPAYGYVPTDLPGVPDRTRVAMAWALGRHGTGTDPVTHAALMLVLHDLMGATYPSGRIDVHRLTAARLAGFGGQEGEVLRRARFIKGEALARGGLEGPLRLVLRLAPDPAGGVLVTVRLVDARGRPVPAVDVALQGVPGAEEGGRTAADGTWRTRGRPPAAGATARATATVPRLALEAWAPTARRAQRVARPALERLEATAALAPPATTTSTTSSTTTTTTAPPATTTSSTTVPPTTTTTGPPPTTVPPTTEPPTTEPPTTTPAPAPPGPATSAPVTVPPTVAGAPPVAPLLPRTGTDPLAWVLVGVGLLLLGASALDVARRGRPPVSPGRRPRAGR